MTVKDLTAELEQQLASLRQQNAVLIEALEYSHRKRDELEKKLAERNARPIVFGSRT